MFTGFCALHDRAGDCLAQRSFAQLHARVREREGGRDDTGGLRVQEGLDSIKRRHGPYQTRPIEHERGGVGRTSGGPSPFFSYAIRWPRTSSSSITIHHVLIRDDHYRVEAPTFGRCVPSAEPLLRSPGLRRSSSHSVPSASAKGTL
jgi:hypothetical protein